MRKDMTQNEILEDSFLKYSSFNMNTLQVIMQSKLYYSHVSQYNDPTEVFIDFDYSEYYNGYKSRLDNPELQDFRHCIEIIMNSKESYPRNSPSQVAKDVPGKIAEIIKSKYRCVSLAQQLSTLMFAHYADAFRGVCLVFDRNNPYFSQAIEVKYEWYYQDKFLGFLDYVRTMKGAYTRKMHEWSYEKEFRLLKEPVEFNTPQLSNMGFLDEYPPEALKAIVLGSRFPKRDWDVLIQLRDAKVINASIYESEVTRRGIRVKPIYLQ